MNGLYEKGYVVVENLYTAPELFRELCQDQIDSFGIVRKKRGVPDNFWSWKPQKGMLIGANEKVLQQNVCCHSLE